MKTILAPLLLALTACGTTHSGTDHDSHDTSGDDAHDTSTTDGTSTAGTTEHEHTTEHEPTSTGHEHTATDPTTDGSSPAADYCECMLVNCHDQYHGTWGEAHPQSEINCNADAAMFPTVGTPAMSGDSLECRLYHCEQAAGDASLCEAAIGGAPCA
ncbi:hypothetical protein SAMN02745121_04768 [Nannocystis exedens]|uniref:Lipoprotein n=1 Tax=Nannocystis exedens TaxID=54 RepID=A0A1I2BSU1_9BACT|nr:hypothetical protein [Nannocystis exedens]PCC71270.1 hypothetical protein NAEX_04344 [Nannocystis exedens]SFE59231.1 hypothetical protein SAMN02745121_04768 [Nannocystis exedens]